MAGFFGLFDYSKPGPGVPKDAPPKAPILLFFELLQRKFWNLIKLNLMINLFNIPALLLGMFVLLSFFPEFNLSAAVGMDSTSAVTMQLVLKFIVLVMLMCVPMVTVGPAQAGFTYVLRNYAREEPTFIWSDFKDNAKKNLKQSIIVSIIDFIVTFFMLWSIMAYLSLSSQNLFFTVGLVLTVLLFVIFVMMHIYIYPLMVTFDLSLKQLYKNAFIFAFMKLPLNFCICLLCAFLILLSFGGIFAFSFVIGIIIYIFLTTALIGFITNFYAYPKLKKYMMKPEETEDGESDSEETDAEEAWEEGEGGEDAEEAEEAELPEDEKGRDGQ